MCYLGGQGVQLVRGLQLSVPLSVRQLLSGEFAEEDVFKDTVQLAPASQVCSLLLHRVWLFEKTGTSLSADWEKGHACS